jgi:type I restriction enzyme S subunit
MKQKTIKLGEICNFFSGFAFKSEEMHDSEGIPVIKIANIQNSKVNSECNSYYPFDKVSPKLDKYMLFDKDILIAMTGQGSVGKIGKMRIKKTNYLINQRVGIIRVDQNIANPEFVYQKIAVPQIEKTYYNLALGAGQPNLSPSQICSLELSIPDKHTQDKIASVLSSYDDLIENNLRRIELLENAARLIYKEWFVKLNFPGREHTKIVDGVPEGWEKGILENLLVLQRGFDLPTQNRVEGQVPIYASTGINGYHNVVKVNGPGVVTGRSGTIGVVSFVPNDFWPLNTALWVREYKDISAYFAFYLLDSLELKNYGAGASVPTLDRKVAHKIEVLRPPKTLLCLFDDMVVPFFKQIHVLNNQVIKLRQARDLLLPKLMSGEIAV